MSLNDLELYNTSLQHISKQQNNPCYHFPTEPMPGRLLKSMTGDSEVALLSNDMHCARISRSVVFGRTYVSDMPKRAAFLNQCHSNYSFGEFIRFYANEILDETRERPRISEESCFLGGHYPFGHFVFEYLYRLVAFDACGLLEKWPLVIFDDLPPSWVSFIELYGVSRIVKIPRLPAPYFDNVWLTTCPNGLTIEKNEFTFWAAGIKVFRQRLLDNAAKVITTPAPRRLFVGRRDAKHRKLANEAELWPFLESLGFVYFDPRDKSAAEQIHAFRAAEVIVAVTGSGSVMTQFAPETCAIIDIVPTGLVGVFGSLGFAVVIGQNYTRIPTTIVNDLGMNADVTVDLETLKVYVHRAIALQA